MHVCIQRTAHLQQLPQVRAHSDVCDGVSLQLSGDKCSPAEPLTAAFVVEEEVWKATWELWAASSH